MGSAFFLPSGLTVWLFSVVLAMWTLQLKAQCTLQDIKAVLLWVMQADAYPVGIP